MQQKKQLVNVQKGMVVEHLNSTRYIRRVEYVIPLLKSAIVVTSARELAHVEESVIDLLGESWPISDQLTSTYCTPTTAASTHVFYLFTGGAFVSSARPQQ